MYNRQTNDNKKDNRHYRKLGKIPSFSYLYSFKLYAKIEEKRGKKNGFRKNI